MAQDAAEIAGGVTGDVISIHYNGQSKEFIVQWEENTQQYSKAFSISQGGGAKNAWKNAFTFAQSLEQQLNCCCSTVLILDDEKNRIQAPSETHVAASYNVETSSSVAPAIEAEVPSDEDGSVFIDDSVYSERVDPPALQLTTSFGGVEEPNVENEFGLDEVLLDAAGETSPLGNAWMEAVGTTPVSRTFDIPTEFPIQTVDPARWAAAVREQLAAIQRIVQQKTLTRRISLRREVERALITGVLFSPELEMVEAMDRSKAYRMRVRRRRYEGLKKSCIQAAEFDPRNPLQADVSKPILSPPGWIPPWWYLCGSRGPLGVAWGVPPERWKTWNQVERQSRRGCICASSLDLIEDEVQDEFRATYADRLTSATRSELRKAYAKAKMFKRVQEILRNSRKFHLSLQSRRKEAHIRAEDVMRKSRTESTSVVYRLTVDSCHEAVNRGLRTQNWLADPHPITTDTLVLDATKDERPRYNVACETTSTGLLWENMFPLAPRKTERLELTPIANPSLEVIVTVSIYHSQRGHVVRSLDVLGSQTLADLRDDFLCEEDLNFGNAMRFRGACFYIGSKLYSDTRYGQPCYSKPIVQFFRTHCPSKISSEEVEPMEDVRLMDIMRMPLCGRTAYLHQGDCEHRVTFDSVRLFDPNADCPYREGYPLRMYSPSVRPVFCAVCAVKIATMLLFQSTLVPNNPTSLCRQCFDRLCYDETNQPVEDFLAIKYHNVLF